MDAALASLNRERSAAAAKAEALSAELRSVKTSIKQYDDAIDLLSGHAVSDRPSRVSLGALQSGVVSHLKTAGAAGKTARDIALFLTENGRITTEPSVSSTLSRMKASGEVGNDRGRWFLIEERQIEEKPLQGDIGAHELDLEKAIQPAVPDGLATARFAEQFDGEPPF
jgi:hypothetical protein